MRIAMVYLEDGPNRFLVYCAAAESAVELNAKIEGAGFSFTEEYTVVVYRDKDDPEDYIEYHLEYQYEGFVQQ